jgi:hypothetical protein
MINFPDSIPEREKLIIQCVKDGLATYNFTKLSIPNTVAKIEILVFEDALKIDNIRVNVSAKCQQQIADLLDSILPTAKIYDWMWHLCENKINPSPQPITSSTAAMIAHSQRVDKLIEKIGSPAGLKSTSKSWILDNALLSKPGKTCNYGWYIVGNTYQGIKGEICASKMINPKTGSYWRVIQGRGFVHNSTHSDYSQICSLVSRKCYVDGVECDILAAMQNKEYANILNHDGILKVIRQPGT